MSSSRRLLLVTKSQFAAQFQKRGHMAFCPRTLRSFYILFESRLFVKLQLQEQEVPHEKTIH